MAEIAFYLVNVGSVSMNKYWGETERVRQASATCTVLVFPNGQRWVVDPSPQPEALARQLFDRTGMRPADVDGVFVTHWHGDHRYGLELFQAAPWLMASAGIEEWRQHSHADGDLMRFAPAEDALPAGVKMMHLPGHTLQMHGLAFESAWGRTAICGDAVMDRTYFANDDGYHNTLDWDAVRETQRMLKREFDVIIPGHDELVRTGR